MYDIHCHILFEIDDGADSIDGAVKMAKLAAEGGTEKIIATPHCNIPGSHRNLWGDTMTAKLTLLNSVLEQKNIGIEILPGHEIFCGGAFLNYLKDGKLKTLNYSRYPLVEFDFEEEPDDVYRKLSSLVAEGYTPIVAHPERYDFMFDDYDAPEKLIAIGCLLQINKGSVMGKFGREAFEISHRMLEDRLAHFIASDGHSPYMRTPLLADVFELVSEDYTSDYANQILVNNPLSVINDKEIFKY